MARCITVQDCNKGMERIPIESWRLHAGHVDRYVWAAGIVRRGDVVNDVACGVGYGAELFGRDVDYHGYDKTGVFGPFPGAFHAVDLNAPDWQPENEADVTVSFETLEHLENPERVAKTLASTTKRALLVSVPSQPTRHLNSFHLHDFTIAEIPSLFPGWRVMQRWEQPAELTHVWQFEPMRRRAAA
jgi:hypothetical protein